MKLTNLLSVLAIVGISGSAQAYTSDFEESPEVTRLKSEVARLQGDVHALELRVVFRTVNPVWNCTPKGETPANGVHGVTQNTAKAQLLDLLPDASPEDIRCRQVLTSKER